MYESGFQVIKDKKLLSNIMVLWVHLRLQKNKSNRTYLFNKYLSDTNKNATSKFLKYVRQSVE